MKRLLCWLYHSSSWLINCYGYTGYFVCTKCGRQWTKNLH